MLSDNIKILRKNKGLTQEELAAKVNVVRQTVSKWEKGLSVPDAEMLQRIAEVLDTNVSQLLGAEALTEQESSEIAEQLSRINEQLVIKNRRSRRIWKTVGVILALFIIFNIVLVILSLTFSATYLDSSSTYSEVAASEYIANEETQITP